MGFHRVEAPKGLTLGDEVDASDFAVLRQQRLEFLWLHKGRYTTEVDHAAALNAFL